MNFNDIPASLPALDDDFVESFLFLCLERRFGVANLRTANYAFNLTLPPGYRVLVPTVWIEGEVSNGGIEQYFWNRLEDFQLMTVDAIAGYEQIGATDQARAVRDCLRAFTPLESACTRLKHESSGRDNYSKWQDMWDALAFCGDDPLFAYTWVSEHCRVPWIRKHAELFVFTQ